MDQQKETEVTEEVIVETIDYTQISYAGKSLDEWDDELTVTMPAIPCSSIDIDRTCATLNNKYQIAYNTYNNLFVSYKELQARTRGLLIVKVEEIDAGYKEQGVRSPGRDRMEDMARNRFKIIRQHEEKLIQVAILKEYFENHKNKLKDLMLLTNSLSYSVNQSDRMYDKASRTNGM